MRCRICSGLYSCCPGTASVPKLMPNACAGTAVCGRRSGMDTVALKDDPELPLQLALSRLLDKAGRDEGGSILYEASMGMTCRRVEMTGDRRQNWGKERKKTMVLDGDGLPVEVDGRPSGSEWNGHYHQ